MTAGDARERVGEIRDGLRRAMRSLSRPEPDWQGAAGALIDASDMTRDLARLCASEARKEGGAQMGAIVTIPPVRCFARVEADKAQAVAPLEEAAEVFAAWQEWCRNKSWGEDWDEYLAHNDATLSLVDECCDVITATCNLLAAIGVTDLTEAMAACERRNDKRGRYGDR